MKAKELMQELCAAADAPVADTVDTLKAGDPERELHKVATCFIATPEVLRAAHAWGAELLITHEPTYYDHRDHGGDIPDDPVMQRKKQLVEQTGLTIYRFHDHTHASTPDGIIAGQLHALPWSCSHDGHFAVTLEQPMTAAQIAEDLEKYWGIAHVRRTGDLDTPMTRLCMMIGAYGDEKHYRALRDTDCEVLIVGETSEWRICEYVRDSAQMGLHRAMLTCGHVGSERAGMEYLAQRIAQAHPDISTRYFECGEVYTY